MTHLTLSGIGDAGHTNRLLGGRFPGFRGSFPSFRCSYWCALLIVQGEAVNAAALMEVLAGSCTVLVHCSTACSQRRGRVREVAATALSAAVCGCSGRVSDAARQGSSLQVGGSSDLLQ